MMSSQPSRIASSTTASVFDVLIEENKVTKLRPVMTWKTKIMQIQTLKKGVPISYGGSYITKKDRTRIATIPVGYADGLRRCLSNRMELLVKETRVKQVGTICMDWSSKRKYRRRGCYFWEARKWPNQSRRVSYKSKYYSL